MINKTLEHLNIAVKDSYLHKFHKADIENPLIYTGKESIRNWVKDLPESEICLIEIFIESKFEKANNQPIVCWFD